MLSPIPAEERHQLLRQDGSWNGILTNLDVTFVSYQYAGAIQVAVADFQIIMDIS